MLLLVIVIAFSPLSAVFAGTTPTPSTNDINRVNEWAHVNQLDVGSCYTVLEFVSTRNFYSCFEYRMDGDTSQILTENSGVNYNTDINDGLYPYTCQNNSTSTMTISANAYVEVRMVFGGESDERFDWTRFNVDPPCSKDECKNGGWEDLGFRNQGQCVRFVETGQDSR